MLGVGGSSSSGAGSAVGSYRGSGGAAGYSPGSSAGYNIGSMMDSAEADWRGRHPTIGTRVRGMTFEELLAWIEAIQKGSALPNGGRMPTSQYMKPPRIFDTTQDYQNIA